MPYGRKIDKNSEEIDDEARREGLGIVDLSWCGRGIPDRLYYRIGSPLLVWLIEIKDPKDRKLTPAEAKFHERHPGLVTVVATAEELHQTVCKLKSRPV
jgi:hypothetical protein